MQLHDSGAQALRASPSPRSPLEEVEALRQDNAALRDRLLKLSQASLLISQSLDPGTVLNRVIEGARALTGARYGALLAFDGPAEIGTLITSGITPDQRRRMGDLPTGLGLLQHLNEIDEPLRLADMSSHPSSVGLPRGHPTMKSFLGTPVQHLGERVGNIYLTEKEGGGEFTLEDEEILVMFAAQAAAILANIHRYAEERRIRSDMDALIDTVPVGVMVYDGKTKNLLSFNREAKRIVRGLSAPDDGRPELFRVMSYWRPDGREILREELPLERAIRGETVRAEEIIIELPDGQKVPTIVNATPILSEHNEVLSVVATIQDMTPLEELVRQRSEFLGMVSHELRTPLTTIKGSAATALNSPSTLDPMEMRQFFQIIDKQVDQMSSLIRDLLSLTRIEAGTFSIAPEPTDAATLVEQARRDFLRGGARNTVEVDIEPDLPGVKADPQRIVQVLSNLFANASRHSPDWSPILVSASRDDVYIIFSVADEGTGISAERLPNLFRTFSQFDSRDLDRHSGGGNGLGLAICKGIVEAHGGRIWAESGGPVLGTRFTFTVPAVEEAVNDASRLSNGSDGTAPAKTRVLAVDDDPQILRIVRSTLAKAGYTPIATDRPEAAERLVAAEKPDLVLMDLMLPGTTGVEVMQRIRGITELPVIFLSAYHSDQDVAQALEAGADDYIVKPFSPVELVARVEAVLRRRAAADRTREREPYLLGDLAIDYAGRRVTVAGSPVKPTAIEYNLLSELSVNGGRVLTHDHLLRRVWGAEYTGDRRILRAAIKKLRRKLGDDADRPTYIFTEPRVGYRMAKPGGGGGEWAIGGRHDDQGRTDSVADLPRSVAEANGIPSRLSTPTWP